MELGSLNSPGQNLNQSIRNAMDLLMIRNQARFSHSSCKIFLYLVIRHLISIPGGFESIEKVKMKESRIDELELFIIKKMVNGDKDVFKHFFDSYYSELCNYVNLYLKDEMLSEEVVQDIFVHFWENREKISINKSVKSYLYSSSKYRSLNQLRNIKRHEEIHSKLEPDIQVETLYDEFDENKLRNLLQAARQALPKKCLQIFELRQDKQLSNKEISDKLGISIKTVENQITIAYKKLRDYLQPFREQIFIIFIFSMLR